MLHSRNRVRKNYHPCFMTIFVCIVNDVKSAFIFETFFLKPSPDCTTILVDQP